MKYKAFSFNPICENTYILWDEPTRQAAIVDAGMYDERDMDVVRSFVEENGLGLSLSLQTHTRFDHVSGLPFLFDTYGLCSTPTTNVYTMPCLPSLDWQVSPSGRTCQGLRNTCPTATRYGWANPR